MNIMFIIYEFPPIGAGASNAAFFLGREMVKKGHNVTVITAKYGKSIGYEKIHGVKVYRIISLRRSIDRSNLFEICAFGLSCALFIQKIASKNMIDCSVAFFTIPSGIPAYFLKLTKNIPYIVSLRGGDVPGFVPELNRIHYYTKYFRHKILGMSNAVVANSEGLKTLSEAYDPYKVNAISNGVDADFFTPHEKSPSNKNTYKFLFVGRFTKQKNLFFILKQMNIVSKFYTDEFEIHFLGGGPDETLLKSYSMHLDISDKIYWHDWATKKEVRKHYQISDCLLLPSLYEGMSNALLEAMACSLPVVASDIPANSQVVINGKTGFLFGLDEPEQFRKIIVHILKNKTVSRNMGRKAREVVLKHHTWEKVSENYLDLLIEDESGF
jgi:glycosyltransferase involved in cell wall biosynthesis